MKYVIVSLIAIVGMVSCLSDKMDDRTSLELRNRLNKISATGDLSHFIFPESDDYANLPLQDPANPVTKEKIDLGKFLFFETGLAQNPKDESCYETYSCGSCHIASAGFLPGRRQGIADGAEGYGQNGEYRVLVEGYESDEVDAQGTRPMNPFNAGYSTNTLWSGTFGAAGVNEGTEDHWTGLAEVNHTGYMGLEAQNIEAFALHRLDINEHVLDDYGYRALFDAAFPEFDEEDRYSATTTSFALGAFIRSFLANEAPFQDWLKGDEHAMTASQKAGALLFFGKARCYTCHKSPSLGAMEFHALGTQDMHEHGGMNTGPEDPRNFGRGGFTGNEEDMFKFKVPQLYNTKDYAYYFHGSSKNSLKEVIEYKMNAKSENSNVSDDLLSSSFYPVQLTDQELDQLLDFVANGLYDANYDRYVPESVPSGNCFPNNDALSRKHLGCD